MPAEKDLSPRAVADHVLLVAPFRRDAALLQECLRTQGITSSVCKGADELAGKVEADDAGPLIISQEALTPRIIDLLSTRLSTQPAWSEIPLVLLLDAEHQNGRVLAELRQRLPSSKLTILQRPVRTLELVTTIRAALAARRRQLELRDHLTWQQELQRELNHRVKNVLANVIAIFHMTMRQSTSLEEFAVGFEGRLSALSRVHSALVAPGEPRTLREIVEMVLAPYRTNDQRIVIRGPALAMHPQHAVTFALCLHELATNAVKYGALSVPSVRVNLSWRRTHGRAAVRIRWIESGGPPVQSPTRRGYGTTFMRSAVQGGMAGTIAIDYRDGGLACEIVLPPGTFIQLTR